MPRFAALLLAAALGGCAGESAPPPVAAMPSASIAAPERGHLLYDTVCKGCHDQQAHWRDERIVHDWPSLIDEVTRWQAVAGQAWRREDIEDVAAYLNRLFYRVPCPLPRCSAGTAG